MLTSCDTPSTKNNVEQDTYVNHSIANTNNLETKEDLPIEAHLEEIGDEPLDDWEPRITSTPAKQPHQPFYLPKSNIEKIKTYFYSDVITNESTIKSLIDNDVILEGYVSNSDGTILSYAFQKEDEKYIGKEFYLAGDYQLRQKLTSTYKDTVYKMLEISGTDNPEQFLQELLASPKITKYTGCIVQQKPVKYGVIDLTSCEEDNGTVLATVLSLYNPEPAQ